MYHINHCFLYLFDVFTMDFVIQSYLLLIPLFGSLIVRHRPYHHSIHNQCILLYMSNIIIGVCQNGSIFTNFNQNVCTFSVINSSWMICMNTLFFAIFSKHLIFFIQNEINCKNRNLSVLEGMLHNFVGFLLEVRYKVSLLVCNVCFKSINPHFNTILYRIWQVGSLIKKLWFH